jgi:hypothetical protein
MQIQGPRHRRGPNWPARIQPSCDCVKPAEPEPRVSTKPVLTNRRPGPTPTFAHPWFGTPTPCRVFSEHLRRESMRRQALYPYILCPCNLITLGAAFRFYTREFEAQTTERLSGEHMMPTRTPQHLRNLSLGRARRRAPEAQTFARSALRSGGPTPHPAWSPCPGSTRRRHRPRRSRIAASASGP